MVHATIVAPVQRSRLTSRGARAAQRLRTVGRLADPDTLPASLGDASDQKVATKLGRAAESSGRLARLIDSLMDVASMATGRFALNPQRFDLGDSLRRLVDYLAPAAARALRAVAAHGR